MYDTHAVLDHIDNNWLAIVLLCGLVAMVPTYIWFFNAIVVGRRDQACAMPPVCTLFWFAHDTSYLARYDDWFNVYDHWYFKLFWAMLVVTVGLELVYITQAIRYGRREWAPRLSQTAFTAICLALLGTAVVVWGAVKSTMDDPLYIGAFGLTVVIYPLAAIPMMLRRGSSKGQSSTMWFGYMGLAIGYFSATALFFGSDFRTWTWIGLGLVAISAGAVGWRLSLRLRGALPFWERSASEALPSDPRTPLGQ